MSAPRTSSPMSIGIAGHMDVTSHGYSMSQGSLASPPGRQFPHLLRYVGRTQGCCSKPGEAVLMKRWTWRSMASNLRVGDIKNKWWLFEIGKPTNGGFIDVYYL